jgi:hypothetical protein
VALIAIAASLPAPRVCAEEREPLLAGRNDTYVALSAYGCYGTCPIFDLYVFPNGKLVFRGHKFTPKTGMFYRTVSPQTYERIRSFLEKHEVFKERGECKSGWSTDMPGLSVFAASGGVHQESYWYWGSDCDLPMVDQIYDLFIMETNTPALVDTDMRRWQQKQRELDKENAAPK